MDASLRDSIWNQFGASLDMLDNAIVACPDEQWAKIDYWYLVYHTLFWTDLYLYGSVDGFDPPEPYTLDELDPAGIIPAQPYTKDELQNYLAYCRDKSRLAVEQLTDDRAQRRCSFGWGEASYLELMLYNMRHIQHGAAQLNLLLRKSTDSAPSWVAKAGL